MVLAKDKVECILKCKLLINNVQNCIVENLGTENWLKKTKKMNNEYHGKIWNE